MTIETGWKRIDILDRDRLSWNEQVYFDEVKRKTVFYTAVCYRLRVAFRGIAFHVFFFSSSTFARLNMFTGWIFLSVSASLNVVWRLVKWTCLIYCTSDSRWRPDSKKKKEEEEDSPRLCPKSLWWSSILLLCRRSSIGIRIIWSSFLARRCSARSRRGQIIIFVFFFCSHESEDSIVRDFDGKERDIYKTEVIHKTGTKWDSAEGDEESQSFIPFTLGFWIHSDPPGAKKGLTVVCFSSVDVVQSIDWSFLACILVWVVSSTQGNRRRERKSQEVTQREIFVPTWKSVSSFLLSVF